MTSKAPERSRETKEKLAENSLTILTELGKLIKQSNKNSSSQEVSTVIITYIFIKFIVKLDVY